MTLFPRARKTWHPAPMSKENLIAREWKEPGALAQIHRGIESAVRKSLEEDAKRDGRALQSLVTRAEIKRRFDICYRWASILINEAGWTTLRIAENLHEPLRAELDGGTWSPAQKSVLWSPDDPLETLSQRPNPEMPTGQLVKLF